MGCGDEERGEMDTRIVHRPAEMGVGVCDDRQSSSLVSRSCGVEVWMGSRRGSCERRSGRRQVQPRWKTGGREGGEGREAEGRHLGTAARQDEVCTA